MPALALNIMTYLVGYNNLTSCSTSKIKMGSTEITGGCMGVGEGLYLMLWPPHVYFYIKMGSNVNHTSAVLLVDTEEICLE